jgi:hypothetical protein
MLELKQHVQAYYDYLECLFAKNKILDVKQHRFLFKLNPKFCKLCMVHDYPNIEAMFSFALEMEQILGELGETPYEPLKEEQDEFVASRKFTMEK